MSGDLDYLDQRADLIARLQAAGATDEAAHVLEGTLAAIDHELAARGNVREPALFETLLLAAQVERELQLVKERARGRIC